MTLEEAEAVLENPSDYTEAALLAAKNTIARCRKNLPEGWTHMRVFGKRIINGGTTASLSDELHCRTCHHRYFREDGESFKYCPNCGTLNEGFPSKELPVQIPYCFARKINGEPTEGFYYQSPKSSIVYNEIEHTIQEKHYLLTIKSVCGKPVAEVLQEIRPDTLEILGYVTPWKGSKNE